MTHLYIHMNIKFSPEAEKKSTPGLQGDHHALKVHLFQIVHQGGGVFLVKPGGSLSEAQRLRLRLRNLGEAHFGWWRFLIVYV